MLIPIRAGAELQRGRDARGSHPVDFLMALPDGLKNSFPFPLNIGAISVQLAL